MSKSVDTVMEGGQGRGRERSNDLHDERSTVQSDESVGGVENGKDDESKHGADKEFIL